MDFSIILPSYNEADNLPPLLRDLKDKLDKLKINYEIVIVDNGSTDNTQTILASLKKEIPALKIVAVYPNIGFGNGTLQGLSVAQGDILGFMDADGQIEAKYLIESYLKLKKEGLDFCKGVRIVRNDGPIRHFLSKIYNLLFKIMFGGNFRDLGAKPKIFTRNFYENTKPISKDWFLDTEIIIKTIKGKYRVGELPIVFLPRTMGTSKVRFSTIFEFLKNMLYWRFFAQF